MTYLETENLKKARKRSDRLVTLIGNNPGCNAAELIELGYSGRWYCGLLQMERAGVIIHVDGCWYLNQTEVNGQGYSNLTNNEAKRLGGGE